MLQHICAYHQIIGPQVGYALQRCRIINPSDNYLVHVFTRNSCEDFVWLNACDRAVRGCGNQRIAQHSCPATNVEDSQRETFYEPKNVWTRTRITLVFLPQPFLIPQGREKIHRLKLHGDRSAT